MRWLVLTDDHVPTAGGVASWTAAVVAGLRTAGHEVRVFARAREELPAEVVGVGGPSFSRRGHLWLGLASFGVPHDRLLCTTWSVVPPGQTGVVVGHGTDLTGPAGPRRARVLARCRVGVVSGYLAGRARLSGASEAEVWPAPVDAAAAPRTGRSDRWAWCGRMVPGKGGERFVRMVAAAGVRGTMIGDGPCRAPWEALARRCGAKVDFIGQVPRVRVRELLRAHDAVVLVPTAVEGLGLALLEGAAEGLVTVGCRVGGVPEAVGEGVIVDDPDDAERAAEGVLAAVREGRGAACWEGVRGRHGVDRCARRLCDASEASGR